MHIRQVENAIYLLQYFAETGRASTLTEIAKNFSWPISSTFKLINTLAHHGYLYEPLQRGIFYPTPKLFELAKTINAKAPLPPLFDELLNELNVETNETVWIAGRSGLNAIFLKVIQSKQLIRYTAEVGWQVPLFATATGQAILSKLSKHQIDSILDKSDYTKYSSTTPSTKEEVLKRIKHSINRGWFSSSSSFTPDLGGVSIPIEIDNKIYAVTTAVPCFRLDSQEEHIAEIMTRIINKWMT